MVAYLLGRFRPLAGTAIRALERRVARWTKPAASTSLVLGTVADLVRGRSKLVAENALLRQQLIVVARSVKSPRLTRADRPLLVLLASRVRAWRQALLIVQPETLLRWHREGFRLFWRWRSAPRRPSPGVAPETIALIRRTARENRLWGAERIQGELAKLGLRVSKRTVQKYLRGARPPRRSGQSWATFLRNHAAETWACDFLQLTDVLFRPSSPSSSSSSAPGAWCTSASRAHRPDRGRRSSCARRRPRAPDRASSSTITTPSTAPSSTDSPPPAASS